MLALVVRFDLRDEAAAESHRVEFLSPAMAKGIAG